MRQISKAEADALILSIRPLCKSLASRSCMQDLSDDIEQELLLAAVKLLRTYDPDKGASFLTYCFKKLSGLSVYYHRRYRYSVTLPRPVVLGQQQQSSFQQTETQQIQAQLSHQTAAADAMTLLLQSEDRRQVQEAIGSIVWSTEERLIVHALLTHEKVPDAIWKRAGVSRMQGRRLVEQIQDKIFARILEHREEGRHV